MIVACQTHISGYAGAGRAAGDAALYAYGELYCRVEPQRFAGVAAGSAAASLKREHLKRYRMPAWLFNAVRVSPEGKPASVREQRRSYAPGLRLRIARAEQQVGEAEQLIRRDQVHQKRRRLTNLERRPASLDTDVEAAKPRLSFGSKWSWGKQHHLGADGYSSHGEWLADWRDARSDGFFVLGSRDETSGCQLCVGAVAADGTLTLRLRIPDCLAAQHGKDLTIQGARFACGRQQVLAAPASSAEYAAHRRQRGEPAARSTGLDQTIGYRFKRDAKSWPVFATTEMTDVPLVIDERHGAVGAES